MHLETMMIWIHYGLGSKAYRFWPQFGPLWVSNQTVTLVSKGRVKHGPLSGRGLYVFSLNDGATHRIHLIGILYVDIYQQKMKQLSNKYTNQHGSYGHSGLVLPVGILCATSGGLVGNSQCPPKNTQKQPVFSNYPPWNWHIIAPENRPKRKVFQQSVFRSFRC